MGESLANKKIKEKFGDLLKIDGGIESSTTAVEDGAGNDSALKLSTTAVEINGALNFTAAPTTDNSETTALLLDNSTPPKAVKRELSSLAFTPISPSTGTTETAAILIDSSGNPVQRDLATTAFKQFPRIIARVGSDTALDANSENTSAKLTYAAVDNTSATASFNQDDKNELPLNNESTDVRILTEGIYRISISLYVKTIANGTVLTTNIKSGATTIAEATRDKGTNITQSMVSFFWSGLLSTTNNNIEVNVSVSSGSCTIAQGSILEVERIA